MPCPINSGKIGPSLRSLSSSPSGRLEVPPVYRREPDFLSLAHKAPTDLASLFFLCHELIWALIILDAIPGNLLLHWAFAVAVPTPATRDALSSTLLPSSTIPVSPIRTSELLHPLNIHRLLGPLWGPLFHYFWITGHWWSVWLFC